MLLAIMSIMAVGVACYVAMASAYNNLATAKAQYYRQCRMADFWIEVKKVPLAELDAVARLPGVAEIRPRIQFFATVDLPGVTRPLNGQVLSLPDRRPVTVPSGYSQSPIPSPQSPASSPGRSSTTSCWFGAATSPTAARTR